MPDVKLGTLELVLAKDKSGVRAFQFLHAVDEPGEPGRVGTIIFDQLHHGMGPELSLAADRYEATNSFPLFTYEPGILRTAGLLTSLSSTVGAVEETAGSKLLVPSSFQHAGDVYFVLPTEVLKVAGGNTTPTVAFTPTAGFSLTGEPTFYDGEWWLGRMNTGTGNAEGHVRFDGTTWTEKVLADSDWTFNLAVHGGMFHLHYVQGVAKNWTLRFTDAPSPDDSADWVDIVTDRRTPIPSALKALGRFILVFGEDGQIVAVADAPPVKSLVQAGVLSADDPAFGFGSRMWGSDLLILSARGLTAINLDRLAGRDVSPVNIQGFIGRRRFRPSALAPMGPDMLVGTRLGTNDAASLLVLRRYPEGVFYNYLRTVSSLADIRALEFLDTGVITVLSGNASTGAIDFMDMPSVGGATPAALGASSLITSATYGSFSGRKLILQVRGFYAEATTAAVEIKIVPDRGVGVSAGTFTAAGPFQLAGARVVGTTFALQILMPSDAVWPRLLLPIMLDYAEEPRAGDRIRLAIEAPVGQRRVDAGGVSVEEFLKDLRDLRNSSSTITLTLLDVAGTPSTFTVLVEAVSSVEDRPALKREFPSAIAFVDLRVV